MSCPAHALAASRAMLVAEDVDLIREVVASYGEIANLLVVDLGAGSGTSALSVFAERTIGVRVLSVDHSAEALYWAGRAVDNIGRRQNWDGVASHDEAVGRISAERAAGASFKVLLIDDDHSYDGVRAALMRFLPLLDADGTVWLHDYASAIGVIAGVSEDYPGVREAVVEAVTAGHLAAFAVKGLGIALKRPAPWPEPAKKEGARRDPKSGAQVKQPRRARARQ